ncbi:hypothetical protein [Sporohalobacter salinus]|uniref:hypothetical protein n=1 Tax=Sporohalobacter salinus TaxID=1494606 RepID=UPI00195FDE8F|nr:hypothetical protein [Sporohalobacter salinus]MBM7624103.1 hypothetical protein [Sporohalobacter salinus]
MHDKEIFDNLIWNFNYIYVFDIAYISYKKFNKFIEDDIYFVTRAKSDTQIKVTKSISLTDRESNILKEPDEIYS